MNLKYDLYRKCPLVLDVSYKNIINPHHPEEILSVLLSYHKMSSCCKH